MISSLGWIGNIFLIWGIWEIGNKRRFAHLLTVIGELAWVAKSIYVKQWDLAMICVVFTFLAWRCWIKWGKE